MFDPRRLDSLPPLFRALRADLVLMGGDMSVTSLATEFKEAKKFIESFGIPTLSIPGNHDCYTARSRRQKHFYRYFSNPITSTYSLREHGVERHDLAHGWLLIALDTATATGPTSSRGLFSRETEAHLTALLRDIPTDRPILFWTHYPLFAHDHPSRTLDRCEALQALLAKHSNIRCYLHGHTHRPTIADLRPSGLPILLDSGCPVQKDIGGWNLLEIKPKSCKVDAYRWTEGWKKAKEQEFLWEA